MLTLIGESSESGLLRLIVGRGTAKIGAVTHDVPRLLSPDSAVPARP